MIMAEREPISRIFYFLLLGLIVHSALCDDFKLDIPDVQDSPPRIIRHPLNQASPIGGNPTLRCAASGIPKPHLQWYHNGSEAVTQHKSPLNSNVVVTKSGDLIIQGMRYSNVGTYFCKFSNQFGSVNSEEARIDLAFLEQEFGEMQGANVTVGESASLYCAPPHGVPAPSIYWLHDGGHIRNSTRVSLLDSNRRLLLTNVAKHDAGRYTCVAKNAARSVESPVVVLRVQQPPHVKILPSNQIVKLGETAVFRCEVVSDTPTTVVWKRSGKLISSARSTLLPDKSLQIEHVQRSDSGEYQCVVNTTSSKGYELVANLQVMYSPNFRKTPDDLVVRVGQPAMFHCVANGEPVPTVRWVFRDEHFFKGRMPDRVTVLANDSLSISSVRKSDEGMYECRASQEAGGVKSSALLRVIDPEAAPIPVIRLGPLQQTVNVDSQLSLFCSAGVFDANQDPHFRADDPRLLIEWYKDGTPLSKLDSRVVILSPNVLQVNAVKLSDAGIYACRAKLGNAVTEAQARIHVTSAVADWPRPMPSVADRLPPPDKVYSSRLSDHSVRLAWQYVGQEAPAGARFLVEFVEYNSRGGWLKAGPPSAASPVEIRSLKPNTGYYFLVRAVSADGFAGAPRILNQVVFTKPEIPVTDMDLGQLRRELDYVQFSQLHLNSLSQTEVQLSWNVCGKESILRVINLFNITYHPAPISHCIDEEPQWPQLQTMCYHPLAEASRGSEARHFCSLDGADLVYPFDPEAAPAGSMQVEASYRESAPAGQFFVQTAIQSLRPFTCYAFQVRPVATHRQGGRVTGPATQPARAMTYEALPSASPHNVAAQWGKNGSVLAVHWSAPPRSHHNGRLTGYRLRLHHPDGDEVLTQDYAADTTRVELRRLAADEEFRVYVAALNCEGEGIRSRPFEVVSWATAYESQQLAGFQAQNPWFVWLLVTLSVVVIWVLLMSCLICRYRRRRAFKRRAVDGAEDLNSGVPMLGGVCGSSKKAKKLKKSKKATLFNHPPDQDHILASNLLMANAAMHGNQKFMHLMSAEMGNNSPLMHQMIASPQAQMRAPAPLPAPQNGSIYQTCFDSEAGYADPSSLNTTTATKFAPGMQLVSNAGGGGGGSSSHGSSNSPGQMSRTQTGLLSSSGSNGPSQQAFHAGDDGANPYATASLINGAADAHEMGPSLGEVIPPPPEYPPPPVPTSSDPHLSNTSRTSGSLGSQGHTLNSHGSSSAYHQPEHPMGAYFCAAEAPAVDFAGPRRPMDSMFKPQGGAYMMHAPPIGMYNGAPMYLMGDGSGQVSQQSQPPQQQQQPQQFHNQFIPISNATAAVNGHD